MYRLRRKSESDLENECGSEDIYIVVAYDNGRRLFLVDWWSRYNLNWVDDQALKDKIELRFFEWSLNPDDAFQFRYGSEARDAMDAITQRYKESRPKFASSVAYDSLYYYRNSIDSNR